MFNPLEILDTITEGLAVFNRYLPLSDAEGDTILLGLLCGLPWFLALPAIAKVNKRQALNFNLLYIAYALIMCWTMINVSQGAIWPGTIWLIGFAAAGLLASILWSRFSKDAKRYYAGQKVKRSVILDSRLALLSATVYIGALAWHSRLGLNDSFGDFLDGLAVWAFTIMYLSIIGIVIGLVVWGIQYLRRNYRNRHAIQSNEYAIGG